MKLVNLQIALFFENRLERPDLFANRINSRLNNSFDAMPQIINLPDEAPADIPVVQMHSSRDDSRFNVSKQRCDLFLSPELLAQTSLSSSVNNCQELFYEYLKSVFEETQGIIRVGLIATGFEEKADSAMHISEKYLSTSSPCKEVSIRINRPETADGFDLNNILEISDGNLINEKLGINQTGIVIKRDINNVPKDGVLLTSKNIKTIWKRALLYFTDKKIGEIK